MDEKYLENVYIQHYLEESDLAIRRFQAALDKGDTAEMKAAAKIIANVEKWVTARMGKIDLGNGNRRNDNGWNPKLPPLAVREIPPEEVRAVDES